MHQGGKRKTKKVQAKEEGGSQTKSPQKKKTGRNRHAKKKTEVTSNCKRRGIRVKRRGKKKMMKAEAQKTTKK